MRAGRLRVVVVEHRLDCVREQDLAGERELALGNEDLDLGWEWIRAVARDPHHGLDALGPQPPDDQVALNGADDRRQVQHGSRAAHRAQGTEPHRPVAK